MPFAKGYRRDRKRDAQKPAHLYLGARAVSFPESGSIEPAFLQSMQTLTQGPVLDQNGCGSCTAHGSAQAAIASAAAQGRPLIAVPSLVDLYAITRSLERAMSIGAGEPLPSLTDSGAEPTDILSAWQRYGTRAAQLPSPQGFRSDCDPSNVNNEIDLETIETDGQKLVTGGYRIDTSTDSFLDQICASIGATQTACGVGIFVDSTFEAWGQNWTSNTPPIASVDMNDSNGGGHWIAVTSYRPDPSRTGKRIFRGPNSWWNDPNTPWGAGGFWEMTDDCLVRAIGAGSDTPGDCIVFNVEVP
jgi:hypothetical protein